MHKQSYAQEGTLYGNLTQTQCQEWFLYGGPAGQSSEKWSWMSVNRQYICITNGCNSWLIACGNKFLSIFSHSQSDSTNQYLLKLFFISMIKRLLIFRFIWKDTSTKTMHGFFFPLATFKGFFIFYLDCIKSNSSDTEQLGKITEQFANICEAFYSRAHFTTTS